MTNTYPKIPPKDGVKEVEAFIAPSPTNGEALPDRDRILNDVVNTGVSAALIGGFALGNLQEADVEGDGVSLAIYMLSCAAHPAHEQAYPAPPDNPCTRPCTRRQPMYSPLHVRRSRVRARVHLLVPHERHDVPRGQRSL